MNFINSKNKRIIFAITLAGLILGSGLLLFTIFKDDSETDNDFRVFQIDGSSMLPTYEEGDVVKAYRITEELKVGDIVIYETELSNVNYIHRIAAVPGDSITCEDDQLKVNDKDPVNPAEEETFCGVLRLDRTLGENEYFVLGDNRDLANDSRFTGTVMKDDIVRIIK